MRQSLIILGAGGFAKEVLSWVPQNKYEVKAFYSDAPVRTKELMGVRIIDDLRGMHGWHFIVAVGDPRTREKLWREAVDHGLIPCDPIIHPSAVVGMDCKIGAGSIICPMAVVTANVRIGRAFILNLAATIGHDCRVDDFVTVSPGANVSGNVWLCDYAYIGTNSAIREKIHVDVAAVVGMGAIVVKDVPRGVTVVGNPAKEMVRR